MRTTLLTLLIALFAIASTAVAQHETPLRELRTIVIDPGHGGEDAGAVGVAEINEKELTLAVALLLRDTLLERDPTLNVVLTRDGDTYPTLDERTFFAHLNDADVLVSLHFNASANPQAHGIETYFIATEGTRPGDLVPGREADGPALPFQEVGVVGSLLGVVVDDLVRDGAIRESALLAETIQASLIATTDANDREVRQGQFRVLRGVRMPAVVVEMGFLTHPEEGLLITTPDYQQTLADGLADALIRYDHQQQQVMAELGVYSLDTPALIAAQ